MIKKTIPFCVWGYFSIGAILPNAIQNVIRHYQKLSKHQVKALLFLRLELKILNWVELPFTGLLMEVIDRK